MAGVAKSRIYKYMFKHQVAIWWSWERGSITIFTNLDCEGENRERKPTRKIESKKKERRDRGAKEKCSLLKKQIKFSPYIRKFIVEPPLQRHI
jgi:hypothetical protein